MGLVEFEELYKNYKDYPHSLWRTGSLVERRWRRSQALTAPTLFLKDEALFKVPFRDFSLDGTVYKWNCLTEVALNDRLCRWNRDATNREDPQCRFAFLVNADRGKPIEITKTGLQRLLTYHQVHPSYLDILNAYNAHWGEDREVRFSTFRSSSVFADPFDESIVPELGRTGRQYQMCFNLKVPVLRHDMLRKTKAFYMIRQVALHHQFDVESGKQVWIIGDPHALVKMRIQHLFPKSPTTRSAFATIPASFKSSLQVHLDLIRWVVEEWRDYNDEIESLIDQAARNIKRNARLDPELYEPFERPNISLMYEVENDVNTAVMVHQAHSQIIIALVACYQQFLEDEGFPQNQSEDCKQHLKRFLAELDELKWQLKMHIDQLMVLKSTVAGRRDVLIQDLNDETIELNKNVSTIQLELALRNSKEAIMMRIITVITLIYLPPTFTSTWFSMDIVKYQSESGELRESFSNLALRRWLSVSLPLLVVTATGAYYWWRFEERKAVERERRRFQIGSQRSLPLEEARPQMWARLLTRSVQALRNRLSSLSWRKRAVGQNDGKSDVELSSMGNGLGAQVEAESEAENPAREPANSV